MAFFVHDPLADATWISVTFLIWSIVEPGVYLIAACLPCYRPLIKFILEGSKRAISTPYRAKIPNDLSSESSYSARKDESFFAESTRPRSDIEMGTPVRPRVASGHESDEQSLISYRI